MLELKIGWTDQTPRECNERPIMRWITGDGLSGETRTLRESAQHNGAALNAGGNAVLNEALNLRNS